MSWLGFSNSITTVKPVQIFEGQLFLAPPLHFMPVLGGGPQGTSVTVPADPVLQGVELGVQIYDPAIGLTRPVFGGFAGQP